MKTIRFIKEPGYTLDLFFIFMLYFNKEHCLANFINYNKSNEDTEYYNKLLNEFLPIPNELLPFFYLKDNSKSFITNCYYEAFNCEFANNYSLSFVQKHLNDYDQVVRNLMSFYFPEAKPETLAECKSSPTAMSRLIKSSNYNGDIKSSLYAFFLEPVPIIQNLIYELMSKSLLLTQKYNTESEKITEFQKLFDFEDIKLKLGKYNKQDINMDSYKNIYVSIVLLSKNCIKTHFLDNNFILLLGIDSESYWSYLLNLDKAPEIDVFGNAIAEKNRVDILELILRHDGEITIKDIEQELGFSGTNSYYHLSLLIKANIIKTRNHGRTVYYSINKHHIRTICDLLNKYC